MAADRLRERIVSTQRRVDGLADRVSGGGALPEAVWAELITELRGMLDELAVAEQELQAARDEVAGRAGEETASPGESSYPRAWDGSRDAAGEGRVEIGEADDDLGQEVVERRRAERALRESEARYHRVLERVPVVVYSAEAATDQFLLVDGAVESMLGCTPAALYADADRGKALIHPDDRARVQLAYDRGLGSQQPFEFECRLVKPDRQEVRWVHVDVVSVIGADGRLIQHDGVVVDITDRKRAEEEARQRQAELSHVSRLAALGEEASCLAQELGQPLAAIINDAEAAMRKLTLRARRRDVTMDDLQRICGQARRATEIINRMRDLVQRGGPESKPGLGPG